MSNSKLESSPATRFLLSTWIVVDILFLRFQKLRPVDFSEVVLSLICRGRSGQGHLGSTTRCVEVQHCTWWHSLSHRGPLLRILPTTCDRIVPMLVYEELLVKSHPKHVFFWRSQVHKPETVLFPGGLLVHAIQNILGEHSAQFLRQRI